MKLKWLTAKRTSERRDLRSPRVILIPLPLLPSLLPPQTWEQTLEQPTPRRPFSDEAGF